MYDIEQYYEAKSIEDAISALKNNPDAIIISGGTDVLIQIRSGKLAGASLVSVHEIDDLKHISISADGTIHIGSGCTFSQITNNDIIKQHIPMLGNAVDTAGGPQLRNAGTIGGNVANGVTSADSSASLMALNATIVLQGADGSRCVPIQNWYTGPGKTVRGHDELITSIQIKREDYENYYGYYYKYGKRNAMEIATLGCAVLYKPGNNSTIEDIRIAYSVAAPTPIRCLKTEDMLRGMSIDDDMLNRMQESVLKEVNPRSSWRASKEFRLQLVKELCVRSFNEAIKLAGGSRNA